MWWTVAALLALAGCSLAYDVDVILRGGRAVFLLSSKGIGGGKAARVEHLWVRPVSNSAAPAWEIASDDINGREVGEITYGVVPPGMIEKAKPVALQVGQVYRVELIALGGGGSTQFVIMPKPGP